MFTKKNKPDKPKQAVAKDSEKKDSTAMKYLSPKILLVDVEKDVETLLTTRGFNVTTGSFGTPYKVPKCQGSGHR